MNSITFGELIKKTRLQKGLSLRQVAAFIDFDQSTLSKVEKNKVIAPMRIVNPLAQFLGLDYNKLQVKYLSERIYREFKGVSYLPEALAQVQRRLALQQGTTKFTLPKATLINQLKAYFQQHPIEKAWLFGSFARKEESYDSDIDLLVRFKQPNQLDLFDYIGMKQELEDITGRQIDLVEEGQLLGNVKPIVELEKMLIYAA